MLPRCKTCSRGDKECIYPLGHCKPGPKPNCSREQQKEGSRSGSDTSPATGQLPTQEFHDVQALMNSLRQPNPEASIAKHRIWTQQPSMRHTQYAGMGHRSTPFSSSSSSGGSVLETASSGGSLRALASIATRSFDRSISSFPSAERSGSTSASSVTRDGSISLENEASEKMDMESIDSGRLKTPKFTWIFRPPDPNLNAKAPKIDQTLDHSQILGLDLATIDRL